MGCLLELLIHFLFELFMLPVHFLIHLLVERKH